MSDLPMEMEQPISKAELLAARDRLLEMMRSYGSAIVALSGGVDSAVVAKAAQSALGDRSLAVTAASASVAVGEIELARRLAEQIGIRHLVVETAEFQREGYRANKGDRCYHCKSELYERIRSISGSQDFAVVCSGANLNDLGDYRPGLTAAAERGVRHPLCEAGIDKGMVRALARHWGLSNAEKPAAPCLSSRIAVGVEATPERTARIDAAERFLRQIEFPIVRVRCHENEHARIEVPVEDLPRLIEPATRSRVAERLRELGFRFIAVDLEGFRTGSLNILTPVELLQRHRPASGEVKPDAPIASSTG